MSQPLRVDTAGVQAMATRWSALAGDLGETLAAPTLGLSCQASASAVTAAHSDVARFSSGLAARVGTRATAVAEADHRYASSEAASATEFAAVAPSVNGG
ncbi:MULTISPECIES: hypothetical protein [unclassified Mycobacterium]|uniref:hypothetical protein n=1 Tax=unclassified Mycobacterium TaxID=2642494 RepID=UPI001E45EA21|nr:MULTISPECIES: hypothetical protein [unclassified Mycobacterium]